MEGINMDNFVIYDEYDNKKSNLYESNIKNDDIIELEDALSISSYPDSNVNFQRLKEFAKTENAEVIPLCVKIEEELSGYRKNFF